MTSISIKFGLVSFDWETQTEPSLEDINQLFDRIESLAQLSPVSVATPTKPPDELPSVPVGGSIGNLHVNSIAVSLNASSGPDLAVAAAATLQLAQGKASFTRQELLAVMKDATKFYNANMSGNLSKILNTLVGSKFNQVGQNLYSLTASEFTKLEALLAQSN